MEWCEGYLYMLVFEVSAWSNLLTMQMCGFEAESYHRSHRSFYGICVKSRHVRPLYLGPLLSEVFNSIEVRFLMALVQWCSCFLFSPMATTK